MGPFTPSDYLSLMALGMAVGCLGTLIGAGGGFVLMPILLLLYPHASADELTAISLAVVFFNAVAGSEAYAFMGRIDYKSGLIFAAATIPGAVIGAISTEIVPRHLFNGIFGILLIAVAIFLVMRPEIKLRSELHTHRGHTWRVVTSADGERHYYNFNIYIGVGVSFLVGYLSSFLGIGGGIIHVPVLVYFLDFPVHIATATSHFVLAIMALTGTAVHMWHGSFHTLGVVRQTMSLAIGVLLGAPIGAQLSNRIGGPWIIRSLAMALGLVGLRILIMYFQH
ncbi:MAG: sulfite exporter TauE/SafE family protein [Desulfobaccales bacterium]